MHLSGGTGETGTLLVSPEGSDDGPVGRLASGLSPFMRGGDGGSAILSGSGAVTPPPRGTKNVAGSRSRRRGQLRSTRTDDPREARPDAQARPACGSGGPWCPAYARP